MDIELLRTFLTVARQHSFTAAANELHLTQPAISRRISQLEEQLGSKLFDRIGKKVLLTESGNQLFPRAREILDKLDDIEREISNLSGEVTGQLRIGTSHHIGLHRLPPYLKRFTQHYPQVELDIRFLDSEIACNQVESGELELAVVTLGSRSSLLQSRTLWDDPLGFMIAKEHPLARAARIDLETLSHYPAILPGEGTYTGEIIRSLFQQESLPLSAIMASNYLETIKMLASIGLGWSILPLTMKDESLVVLPVRKTPGRQLGLVTHRSRTLSNAATAFTELLPA